MLLQTIFDNLKFNQLFIKIFIYSKWFYLFFSVYLKNCIIQNFQIQLS